MNEQLTWEETVEHLLSQDDQRELIEACYFDSPIEACAERFSRSDEWQCTRSYLPDISLGSRALDVGAGRGIASYALAKEGWRVTALEPDQSNLVGAGAITRLAQNGSLDITVVVSEGESLPFDDGIFDLVYLRQVLHHANDLPRLCAEIGRVLKRGGTLIAVREHVVSRHSDMEKFFERHPLHRFYGGEFAYLLDEYISALTDGGIEVTDVLPPYSSPINLSPWSREKIRHKIYEKTKLMSPLFLVDALLHVLDRFSGRPGRLYGFIGRKP